MKRFLLPAISTLVILTACTEKKHLKCDCTCTAAEKDEATFSIKALPEVKASPTPKFQYGQKVKLNGTSIYRGCTGTVEEALETLREYEIELWSCPKRKDMEFIPKRVFITEADLEASK